MHRSLLFLSAVSWALFIACSPAVETATPSPAPEPSPSPSALPVAEATATQTNEGLTLWVTEEFEPDPGTAAGAMLADRLAAFEEAHPGLELLVRTKAVEGSSGLLETLAAATVAAPMAVPDLVTLDSRSFRRAAEASLTIPLDDVAEVPSLPEWYEHAIAASRFQNGFYGLVFASQTDLLAYRTALYEVPPLSWNDILVSTPTFLFPAADPDAAFTLAQYLDLGGELSDSSGNAALDPAILADVLAFYASARTLDVIPLSVRQYSSSEQTWNALQAEQTASAVAPFSEFLPNQESGAISAIPLPTRNSNGTCLTRSWAWAIVAKDPERQALAAELLTWLMAPEFLGPWTLSLNLLPPTQSSLSEWPQGMQSAIANRLVTTCRSRPSQETLAVFGPPLQAAVEAILSGGTTPESAALAAAQSVQRP